MKRVPSLPEVRVRGHDPVVLGEVLELDRPGGLYHRVRQGDLGEGVRNTAAGLRLQRGWGRSGDGAHWFPWPVSTSWVGRGRP